MSDDSCFLHGGEFSLGSSQLLRIQPLRLVKHQRNRTCKQVMADSMTWLGGCETVRGEHVWELGEQQQERGGVKHWNRIGRSMDDNIFRTLGMD